MKKVIYKYKLEWKMACIYDWDFMRNDSWKPIYKYNLDLKMTYENKWELKPDYKYKWDIFLDYMMKNHDIHVDKNVCPEIDGEEMREHEIAQKLCESLRRAFMYI